MRILLVEDDPLNRGQLTDALRKVGYHVDDCSDAIQALESVRIHGRPDLLVTDLALPVMSGEEMLKRPEMAGIPTIIATAKVTTDTLPPDIEVIIKPFTLKDFMAKVRKYEVDAATKG